MYKGGSPIKAAASGRGIIMGPYEYSSSGSGRSCFGWCCRCWPVRLLRLAQIRCAAGNSALADALKFATFWFRKVANISRVLCRMSWKDRQLYPKVSFRFLMQLDAKKHTTLRGEKGGPAWSICVMILCPIWSNLDGSSTQMLVLVGYDQKVTSSVVQVEFMHTGIWQCWIFCGLYSKG